MFLSIIHAYGVFCNEKTTLKKFDSEVMFRKNIIQKISMNEVDTYSQFYRENGCDSGISESSSYEIKAFINNNFSNLKSSKVTELIKSEINYKNLKRTFADKYPDLKDEMIAELNLFISNKKEKKDLKIKQEDAILSLSKRFQSFVHYTFNIDENSHYAYNRFASLIIKKYSISVDQKALSLVASKIISKSRLNLNDIHFVATILKAFISNVSNEDLNDMSLVAANSKNTKIAQDIINSNFSRFKNLLNVYNDLNSPINED
jgi:hypothetical protein